MARYRERSPIILVLLLTGCSSISDTAGYAIVTQDKYDFSTCADTIAKRDWLAKREKEQVDLAAKAEAETFGFLVSAIAYQSDLAQTRGLLRAAERAVEKNNCTAAKP